MSGWVAYTGGSIGHQMSIDWAAHQAYEMSDPLPIRDYEERKSQSKTTINGKRVCPECGKELKVRTNKKNGTQFWGCSGWRDEPRCFFTAKLEKDDKDARG